jgi:hypothetical protein
MSQGPTDITHEVEKPLKAAEDGTFRRRSRRSDRTLAEDPSVHFLVDPPKPRKDLSSWFALAILAGVLLALAIIAVTT